MNKTLSKAFMTRARLGNKYNKTRTEEDRTGYAKFKIFCTNLLIKEIISIMEILTSLLS